MTSSPCCSPSSNACCSTGTNKSCEATNKIKNKADDTGNSKDGTTDTCTQEYVSIYTGSSNKKVNSGAAVKNLIKDNKVDASGKVNDKQPEEKHQEEGNNEEHPFDVYFADLHGAMVIDAERIGGIARFANHCCWPNCIMEVCKERVSHFLLIRCPLKWYSIYVIHDTLLLLACSFVVMLIIVYFLIGLEQPYLCDRNGSCKASHGW